MRVPIHDRPATDSRRRPGSTRPIGYHDMCLVADAITDVAPDWTVELSAIGPDDTSLVIMPEGADDLIGPTFIVYQERNVFRLDQFQWDILSGLGEYRSLRDAVLAVVSCLTHLTLVSPAVSTLRH
jgi:hypothetical protein